MANLKIIFNLLFLFFLPQTVIVASLPVRTGALFRNLSMGMKRPYHTDMSLKNRDQWKKNWQKFHKNVFGPHELPVLKEKGIEGFTVDQIKYLTESQPKKALSEIAASSESKLTQLGKQAIEESNKKSAERAEAIEKALSKKED